MLSEAMRAIGIGADKSPSSLYIEERAIPVPAARDVLVRIGACGVNRGDCLQRIGGYPPPRGASDIMGLEFAGEIVACGADVSRDMVGVRIAALVAGGGYAEYALVDIDHILPLPDAMSYIEGACLPEAIFTVWANLFESGGLIRSLEKGDDVQSVLIHGGASGIGTMAIQMARLTGATIFATAGGDKKCAALRALGVTHAIDYRTQDFVEIVKTQSEGGGVDIILDIVGGDYIARNIACAARGGRIVNIAYLRGSRVEVDFLPMMLRNLTLTGSTLRARSNVEKARLAGLIREHIWHHLGGAIVPVLDSVFRLEAAGLAHEYMESNQNIGKIILDCGA